MRAAHDRCAMLCIAALLLLGHATVGASEEVPPAIWPLQTLVPPNIGALQAGFAELSSLDRNTAIVIKPGIQAPNAVVFRESRGRWQFDSLLPEVPGGGEFAFTSVALEGDWALVGALESNTTPFPPPGFIAAYRRVRGAWTFWQTIRPPEDAFVFGQRLAFDGKTLVVSSSSSVAYVFELEQQQFVFKARLTPPGDSFDPAFAFDVAAGRGYAAISSTSPNDQQGAVYIYHRSRGWALTQTLVRGSPGGLNVIGTMFGARLSANGRTLAISAPYDDFRRAPGRFPQAGAIYVFRDNGRELVETARIPKPDAGDGAFGENALTIKGNTLAADIRGFLPFSSTPLIIDRGYVFKRARGTWRTAAQIPFAVVTPDISQRRLLIVGGVSNFNTDIFIEGQRDAMVYDVRLSRLPFTGTSPELQDADEDDADELEP